MLLRAVLDANAIVSAAIQPAGPPGLILAQLLRDEAFVLVVSPAILAEARRSLGYPRVRKCLKMSEKDMDPWLGAIAIASDVVEDRSLPARIVVEDPEDDKYVAAALEGRADFIVSGDEHLLKLRAHEGIPIVTPREFLRLLTEPDEQRTPRR